MISKIQEIREATAQKQAELETRLQQLTPYFVSPADGRFISGLIERAGTYVEQEILQYNCAQEDLRKGIREEAYEMTPFSLNENEKKIFDRVVNHATYHKSNGEIKYQLNGDYLNKEEVLNILKEKLKTHKHLPAVRSYFLSFAEQIGNGNNLSAKQILIIERVLKNN